MRLRSICAAASLMISCAPAFAVVYTQGPSAVAQANSNDGVNFTTDTNIANFTVARFTDNLGTEQRAVMEFNLSSVPSIANVSSASLTLFIQSATAAQTNTIYGYVGDNAIQTSDASIAGKNLLGSQSISAGGSITIPLNASFVQSYITNHASAFGILVYESTADRSLIISNGFATPGPSLSITYTPEPGSAMLLAGVAGAALRRRRTTV